jgi:hypothetical protein
VITLGFPFITGGIMCIIMAQQFHVHPFNQHTGTNHISCRVATRTVMKMRTMTRAMTRPGTAEALKSQQQEEGNNDALVFTPQQALQSKELNTKSVGHPLPVGTNTRQSYSRRRTLGSLVDPTQRTGFTT